MSDFSQRLKILLPEIMSSPRLFPHTLDMEKGQALIIEADQALYKNAIFLDQRVLSEETKGAWVPLEVLWGHVGASQGVRAAPANFIFHTGHSGSTLISRLLDEVPSVLGLREPLPLRTMAIGYNVRETLPPGAFEGAFNPTCQLLTRRFSPEQQVVIKATSMCNNLASLLLSQSPANRGLLLYVSLKVFLANMLDKKEIPDIEGFFDYRLIAIRRHVPDLALDVEKLSRGEKIAFSWLAEATELSVLTAGDQAQKALYMDFDQFLKQMDIHLGIILNHFDLPGGDEALGKILASPVLKSYAKQPGFDFSHENRSAILQESGKTNKVAIESGISFVEDLMKKHPELAPVSEKITLV